MAHDDQLRGPTPAFVQHLTGCQSALYAFIVALLGGAEGAQDVLQETNVVLWNKVADYDPAKPFLPWAYAFARFQVLAWRKRQSRCRLVLDDELVQQVAEEFVAQDVRVERHLDALEGCLGKLPPTQRELLDSRYAHGEAVNEIAARLGRPQNVVAASLYRIRKTLLECVQTTLAREAGQ